MHEKGGGKQGGGLLGYSSFLRNFAFGIGHEQTHDMSGQQSRIQGEGDVDIIPGFNKENMHFCELLGGGLIGELDPSACPPLLIGIVSPHQIRREMTRGVLYPTIEEFFVLGQRAFKTEKEIVGLVFIIGIPFEIGLNHRCGSVQRIEFLLFKERSKPLSFIYCKGRLLGPDYFNGRRLDADLSGFVYQEGRNKILEKRS